MAHPVGFVGIKHHDLAGFGDRLLTSDVAQIEPSIWKDELCGVCALLVALTCARTWTLNVPH
jgi:hypothetical protein